MLGPGNVSVVVQRWITDLERRGGRWMALDRTVVKIESDDVDDVSLWWSPD